MQWTAWENKVNGNWCLASSAEDHLLIIPDRTGQVLYSRHELWSLRPSEALQHAAQPSTATQPFVDLDLLGGRVRVTSEFSSVIERIGEDLASAVASQRRTADVVIEFTDEKAIVRFMRALDEGGSERVGVKWREASSPNWQPCDTGLPVIPPLRAAVYADRFLCLHAAALCLDSNKGIVICGERGSGKTTTALWAAKELSGSLLTDEATFVEHRSLAVLGVPMPIGLPTSMGKERYAPSRITNFYSGAVQPVAVLVLEKGIENGVKRIRDQMEAFRSMLPHLRNAGSSLDLDMLALWRLSGAVSVFTLSVPPWPELLSTIDSSLRTIVEQCRP